MKIVIKIGGSVIFDEHGPRISLVKEYAKMLNHLKITGKVSVAIGGGKYLRNYISKLENFSPKEKETVAIELLRANVAMFSIAAGMKPCFSEKEIRWNCVMGGITPGRSTDANAALMAKELKADMLVKMTDVDGIYDSDPDENPGARLLKTISFNNIGSFAVRGKPGLYGILDAKAISIIQKNKIKSVVMNGSHPENLLKLIEGSSIGTMIC